MITFTSLINGVRFINSSTALLSTKGSTHHKVEDAHRQSTTSITTIHSFVSLPSTKVGPNSFSRVTNSNLCTKIHVRGGMSIFSTLWPKFSTLKSCKKTPPLYPMPGSFFKALVALADNPPAEEKKLLHRAKSAFVPSLRAANQGLAVKREV
ncbi:hypothetical protein ACFX11_031513 [Malus domestica]